MSRLLVLLALALVAAACGSSAEPEGAAEPGPVAEMGIAGETLDGERVSLEDFRGEPVFVNVWSSW
jgi:hypothetical protein